jgi:hypothetical protein
MENGEVGEYAEKATHSTGAEGNSVGTAVLIWCSLAAKRSKCTARRGSDPHGMQDAKLVIRQ